MTSSSIRSLLAATLIAGAPLMASAQVPQYGANVGSEQARKIVAGAMAEARKISVPMAVAVVDTAGQLVAFERMDNTQTASIAVAQDKAGSAALYRRPTKVFQDALAGGGAGLRILTLRGANAVEGGVPITVDGQDLTVAGKDGKPAIIKVGCDGITMDGSAEWVYYGPLSGHALYRVRVADLNDESLTPAGLSAKVERYSDKPVNGGFSIDADGNVYATLVESKEIGLITPDRKNHIIASDPEMVWPDGISYSPDGHMYVSASQLPLAAMFHDGVGQNKSPYLIFRFKPLAPSWISR